MNIDKQIRYWAQLVNESEDDRFSTDKSSAFLEDKDGNVKVKDHLQLKSLEGAPQKVGGEFYCSDNPTLLPSARQIREYKEFLKHPKPEQIIDGHFHSLLGQSEDR